jgi:phosphoribosylformylglycinamidine synthase
MSGSEVTYRQGEPEASQSLAAEFGLAAEEYALILSIMGRTPTLTELGIFSAMWSEHCSYKSSRVWLSQLHTSGRIVIQGPGENAGVIDIGDGQAAVFKMESHNHPSFIEPYQGAATGVGGILRDVFTMGARPIANVNALRFGAPDHPKTRHLLAGVVAGIGGYGNCMGIPTVAGEVNFHPAYNGNILVNAMTVGIADADKIFYSRGAEVGQKVVYVGSKTGRDGIHGATMASAEFTDEAEQKRPTVQVGDPFTEKLLLEACLELMATDAIVCIQDMGAAGLTSSSVEIADKARAGMRLDLDQVPQRETGMSAYEIMLSESQERMLMVLKPGSEEKARAIFEKWDLDFAVIGEVTNTGRLVITKDGATHADMEVAPLVDKAPKYHRPWEPTKPQRTIEAGEFPLPSPATAILKKLVGSPDMASKRWITEQYDSLVGGNTLAGPGGDAAVVRVPGHETKALAITSDCTPRYVHADPVQGGAQAVAEAWRNLVSVGALPLAATDNMNFGNPQRPRIMGQFAGAVQGMAAACQALDFPIVSGNVSLYNETNGEGILPTPVIGGVGLVRDWRKAQNLAFKNDGDAIVMIGLKAPKHGGHIGQSLYLREIFGEEIGAPPPVDLDRERHHGLFILALIEQGVLTAVHDVSDGGLLCALADMALAGRKGATLAAPEGADPAGFWFGEDQARYVVTASHADLVLTAARNARVPAVKVGSVGGLALTVAGGGSISVEELRAAHEGWLPNYMERGVAAAVA